MLKIEAQVDYWWWKHYILLVLVLFSKPMAHSSSMWYFPLRDENTWHEWKSDSSNEKTISLRLWLSVCTTEGIICHTHLCFMWWEWKRGGNWRGKQNPCSTMSVLFLIESKPQASRALAIWLLINHEHFISLFKIILLEVTINKRRERHTAEQALIFSTFNSYWSNFKMLSWTAMAKRLNCNRLCWSRLFLQGYIFGSSNNFLGTWNKVLKEMNVWKKLRVSKYWSNFMSLPTAKVKYLLLFC